MTLTSIEREHQTPPEAEQMALISSRLAAIVASSDDAIISKSLDGTILTWNRGAERIFGYAPEEVIGKSITILVPPDRRAEIATILAKVRAGQRVDHFETMRRRKDGVDIVISVTISPIHDRDGVVVAASKVARDITDQRDAAAERDRIFDLSIDMLASATLDGVFSRINPAFESLLGYETADLVGARLLDFVHPEDIEVTSTQLAMFEQGVASIRFESRFRTKLGDYRWLSWRCAAHASGVFYAAARDVHEEMAMKAAMAAAIRDKDVLLQEVHHRVKNNLQIISSLVSMQVRRVEQPEAGAALAVCQSRIQAIAMIHESLYRTKNFSSVPFATYIRSLAGNILEACGNSIGARLAVDVDEVELPVDKAIPCGLIVHELVMNSLKHAFPSGREGCVRVTMSAKDARVTLTVSDNGVGLPAGFDARTSRTLGLQLVSILAEQLEANLTFRGDSGASFEVSFSKESAP